MENKLFYKILDSDLEQVIKEKKETEEYSKRKNGSYQLKSYAFMDWFLKFYGRGFYGNGGAIVDGPGDSSCDIIFSKMNFQNEMIYYVVQSKWNVEDKCDNQIDSGEIKKALNDFQTILEYQRQNTQNQKFNERLKELSEHIRKNGKVEFLFIALCKSNPDIEDNIRAFNQKNRNMNVRVFDIEHIKRDYIDVKYKKLDSQNLLERKYNPKAEEIKIPIERLGTSNNQIIIPKPFEATIVLVRPSFFYRLFEKYGYSLFIENVRNPIKKSEINKRMQETLQKNPAYFWYYNNGVTAITESLPSISKQSEEFNIKGLQIINGAQTVHAIHSVYSELGTKDRERLDEEVLILFRLYKSGGEDFNRNVTKFTNAQNQMDDRDYWANDPIQIRLQNESFNTKYWYEKRRDEFVDKPEEIHIFTNQNLAGSYLAFYYSLPYMTRKAFTDLAIDKYDALFLSKKEDGRFGWYEYIFSPDTKYSDLLAADIVFYLTRKVFKPENYYDIMSLAILGLFKPVFEKYLQIKYNDNRNAILYILDKYEKNELKEIYKTIIYIHNYILKNYKLEFIKDDDLFLNKEIQNLKVLLPVQLKLDDIESIEEIKLEA